MTGGGLHAAVLGAAGYIGGELLRILATHPQVTRVTPMSRTSAGALVSDMHPAFSHDRDLTFAPFDVSTAAKADVTFLALGHGESASLMPGLLAANPRLVVDLAADFRLVDRDAYAKSYGEHPSFHLAESFVYGLPEKNREQLPGAGRIAAPGCMATASILTLLPLAARGLCPERPAVFAITGSSGSGREPKATTHHPFRASNLFVYQPLAHRHEAEIARVLGEASGRVIRPRMIAHSAPIVRGIHASAHVADARLADTDVATLYSEYYRDEPFVRVIGEPPHVGLASATNRAFIHVTQNEDEVLVACVIDNLMKGGSGQAVQCMNIALELPEGAGLDHPGVFPI
ncbi:N-acetyl-gamma-glutamyl-phosphate reductase [bacterium]|nr:N-acetyl-gamma-glutamyl-phosphate reductase [bacterium]